MKTNTMMELIQDSIFNEYGIMFDEMIEKVNEEDSEEFFELNKAELLPFMRDYIDELKYKKLSYQKLMSLIRLQIFFDEYVNSIVHEVVKIYSDESYDGDITLEMYKLMEEKLAAMNNSNGDEMYTYRCYILFKLLTFKYDIDLEFEELFASMQAKHSATVLEEINVLSKARALVLKLMNIISVKQTKEYLDQLFKQLTTIEMNEEIGIIHEYETDLLGQTIKS